MNFEQVNINWEILEHNFKYDNELNNNKIILFATETLHSLHRTPFESNKRKTSCLKYIINPYSNTITKVLSLKLNLEYSKVKIFPKWSIEKSWKEFLEII